MIILAFTIGCVCALGWSASQSEVADLDDFDCDEPDRLRGVPVSLVLVASDGSQIGDRIDRATGRGGFSHCYIDVGHALPDGKRLVVDYQPGAGVHYADASSYEDRSRAVVRLRGAIGEQVYGCVRARLGQPFNAAGMLVGRATAGTCAGLVWSCLPPRLRCQIGSIEHPLSPNDLAAHFDVRPGMVVDYREPEES